MLIKLLLNIFNVDYKNHYFSKFTFISELFIIFFTLLIYYYTSKTFSSSVNTFLPSSYFDYIIIGEVFLSLPLYFLDTFIRKVKQGVYDGTLQTLLILPLSFSRAIFTLGISGILRELIREFITILFAILFFHFTFPLHALIPLLLLELIFIPLFLLLGYSITIFLLFWGRGENLIGYMNTILSFLAGAFFPLAILPEWIQYYSKLLSPYTFILEQIRLIFATNPLNYQQLLISCGVWYLVVITIFNLTKKLLVPKLYQKGLQFILTT